MSNQQVCATCGCELPADSLQGHCPDCLLRIGMEVGEAAYEPTLDTPAHESGRDLSSASPPTPSEVSKLLPQLEVLELLGYGGMGAVYKARQKSLDRIVALKMIKTELASVGGFADRFVREAKALAKLNHPNIVGVHDFGQVNGQFYLVMEYVDGTDLRRLIATRQLDPEQAIAIVPKICEALQYAHDQGIVHRDIKPENILVDTRGQVKIADFGLAKLVGENDQSCDLTGSNQVMGTLKYMAPEQMEGAAKIDHRADIYSLGVVFYELLTGELPLGRFAAPSQKAAIDQRLDQIVMRALERELPERYQQASEMKMEVERVSGTDHPSPPSSAPPPQSAPVATTDTNQRLGSLKTHVRIVAAINIAFGGLVLAAAVIVMVVLPSIGAISGDGEALRVLSTIGAVAAGILLILALPEIAIGIGLWQLKPWSRIAGIVLAAINLINIPFGTLLSIYMLWVLMPERCSELFKEEQYYI